MAAGPLKALREVEYASTTKLPFLGLRLDTALAEVHYLTPLKVVSGRIQLSTTISSPRWLGTIGLILVHHNFPYIHVTFCVNSASDLTYRAPASLSSSSTLLLPQSVDTLHICPLFRRPSCLFCSMLLNCITLVLFDNCLIR